MTFEGPISPEEAVAYLQRKELLPTNLSSIQISRLIQQLKQRGWFSARMDKASVLQVLADNVAKYVSNAGIEDENGRLRSIPEAKSQLREALVKAGVAPAEPGKEGRITDFYSDKRRQLMIETNALDTLGAGRHIAQQNSVALMINPGLELVRVRVPKGGVAAERDWIQRWKDAMAAIGSDAESGCTDPDECGGRMVALVNHPIWGALGNGVGGYTDTLGNPWAPFAFSSGMSQEPVPRDECVELGIMTDDQTIEPDDSIDINQGLQANADRFSAALQAQLEQGGLQIVDGVLRLLANRARRIALLNSNPNHDSLGRFAVAPGSLSRRDNIRRGKKAIERALRTKRDVRDAMMVKGLGTVHFEWGRPGTSKANEKGATHFDGYGISHIQAKRGDKAVGKLPVVLARGRVRPHSSDPARRIVRLGDWAAIVEKKNKTNTYVVSSIDKIASKKLGRLPGGQSAWDEVGNRVVNPCPTRTPLLLDKGTPGASNVINIPQSRERLKRVLALMQEAA